MKYNIMSLEHIALVKVASTLWNQIDIRALIAKYDFRFVPSTDREKWEMIEVKVTEKVPQLMLPIYLRENLFSFIKCVGMQLLKWLQCCNEKGKVCMKLLNNIVWTPQGTIDRKKTAKALIEDKTIHILTRYKLADVFWLMDDIPGLFREIPEDLRRGILSKQGQIQLMVSRNNPEPYFRLDSSDEEDEAPVESHYHLALKTAAKDCNQAAVEYLLQKLSAREREESLPSIAAVVVMIINSDFPSKPYRDILWFLFSEINEEQQIELFKSYPVIVFECLLEYPNQRFFMETASCMWSYFPGISFYKILEMIINKVLHGYKDYNYKKLLREFWRQSPPAMKNFIVEESCAGRLLYRLCQVKDKENIEIILNDMAVADKNKFISSEILQCICNCIMYCDYWDFLDLFVKKCVSSKDEMVRFREELKRYITELNSADTNLAPDEEEKKRLFHLLDDFVSEYTKRKCMEEDGGNPMKVLCSAE